MVQALETVCAQMATDLEAAKAHTAKVDEEAAKEFESIRTRMADIGGDVSDLERTVARVAGAPGRD